MTRTSVSGVIPKGACFHRWRLGIRQFSFGHIARVLRHTALDASRRPSLFWHALVPLSFRGWVSQLTQEPFLQVPPGCAGDTTKRLTAHVPRTKIPRMLRFYDRAGSTGDSRIAPPAVLPSAEVDDVGTPN